MTKAGFVCRGVPMKLQQQAVRAASGQQASGASELQPSRARRASRLAWFAWTLSLFFICAALVLSYLGGPSVFLSDLVVNALGTPTLLAYSTVGALIASRHPQNPMGWIFCASSLVVSFGFFAEEYARYALVT